MNERVMNVAKWSRNVSMSIVLGIFLAACGDDDSSFAPRDEDSSSSICEDCDETTSSSSVIPASSGDLQSSSSNKESSSSAKSSSSVRSSSSAPVEDLSSSSSVKSSSSVASSSSAKSSSSVSSSSAKSSSSESSSSVKSSSSSAKSSSSEKSSSSAKSSSSVSSSSSVKSSSSLSSSSSSYSHLRPLNVDLLDQYKTFVDERNDRSYYYITIRGTNSKGEADSVTVMAENLNIGKMIGSGLDQANDTLIERYCYDRDTTNCDRYGGLYQWAEMMQLPSRCNTESCADSIKPNHQGICPDGWRLLTQDDFYVVLHADNNKYGIKGVRSEVFGGQNSTGYSLVGAGYVLNRKLKNIGESAGWFYTEEGVDAPAEGAFVSSTAKTGDIFSTYEMAKTNGLSVRCVKLEE